MSFSSRARTCHFCRSSSIVYCLRRDHLKSEWLLGNTSRTLLMCTGGGFCSFRAKERRIERDKYTELFSVKAHSKSASLTTTPMCFPWQSGGSHMANAVLRGNTLKWPLFGKDNALPVLRCLQRETIVAHWLNGHQIYSWVHLQNKKKRRDGACAEGEREVMKGDLQELMRLPRGALVIYFLSVRES